MMGSDFEIMQSWQESYFPEACINKWVLGAASVNGQNCHHVIKACHKFGVTDQMGPHLECHNKGQQFHMGDDVSLLGDKLWEWGVEVITFAHPSSPYQGGIHVNKSTWLKKHIQVDWLLVIEDQHNILPPLDILHDRYRDCNVPCFGEPLNSSSRQAKKM